jgi:thiol-disulfide isomerase/thioredoxin
MKPSLRGALALLPAALLLFVSACSQEKSSAPPQAAPDFAATSIDGRVVRLSEYLGQVVLLDFWATWCPPCRAALPHLVEMQNAYRADGFVILGMNMDKDPQEVASFLERNTVNYPILPVEDDVRRAYGGISTIPTAMLVDRQGRIRQTFLGYDRRIAQDMEKAIRALLSEGP